MPEAVKPPFGKPTLQHPIKEMTMFGRGKQRARRRIAALRSQPLGPQELFAVDRGSDESLEKFPRNPAVPEDWSKLRPIDPEAAKRWDRYMQGVKSRRN